MNVARLSGLWPWHMLFTSTTPPQENLTSSHQLNFGQEPSPTTPNGSMLIHGDALFVSLTQDSKMDSKSQDLIPEQGREFTWEFSPLHASMVGLICNPNTNRIGPQFHCIHDDHFETVTHKEGTEPPRWDDICSDSFSSSNVNDLEFNENDPDQFKFDWDSQIDEQDNPPQREPVMKEDNPPQRDPQKDNPPQREPVSVPEATTAQTPSTDIGEGSQSPLSPPPEQEATKMG